MDKPNPLALAIARNLVEDITSSATYERPDGSLVSRTQCAVQSPMRADVHELTAKIVTSVPPPPNMSLKVVSCPRRLVDPGYVKTDADDADAVIVVLFSTGAP